MHKPKKFNLSLTLEELSSLIDILRGYRKTLDHNVNGVYGQVFDMEIKVSIKYLESLGRGNK